MKLFCLLFEFNLSTKPVYFEIVYKKRLISNYNFSAGNPSMSTLLASTNSQNSTLSKIDGVDVEMQPLVRHLPYGFTGHVTGGGRRSTIDVTGRFVELKNKFRFSFF